MNESPKFIAAVAIGTFVLASAAAWGIIATANPYSGANFAAGAMVSCPIYLLGVLAGVRCLRVTACRSFLGWLALGLNLAPFGFTALLIGMGVTGNW